MRKFTNKIIEMVDEGLIDRDMLVLDLLNWMSESDVAEFYDHYYGQDEDEDDGQPSEMDEWHDYDPGC